MEIKSSKRNPYAEAIYLHIVAGKMLFPNNGENFVSYFCLGLNDVFSSMICDGMKPDVAFSIIYQAVLKLFPNDLMPNLSWEQYQYYSRSAQFPTEGKGSIEERKIRGQFAGALLNCALMNSLSLTKAAETFEAEWDQKRTELVKCIGPDPLTITASNFMQNIWPEFKKSAHLWAAYQDFSFSPDASLLGHKFPFLRLSNLTELGEIVFNNREGERCSISRTIWPSKYTGWRSFIYKSNHILAECTRRGNVKNSTKPLLLASECWQFPIPDLESF